MRTFLRPVLQMRLVEKKVREEWGRIRGPKEGGKEEGRGWDCERTATPAN